MASVCQNQIALTLGAAKNIARVRSIVQCRGCDTRQEIAREVCREFGFRDRRGRLQVTTCLTALRRLERSGRVELPASRTRASWQRRPRLAGRCPSPAVGVPATAGQIEGLRLDLVGSEADRRLWNELLFREHPQGERIITGRQLRYFIRSDHGVLGAIGVSSAALHLQARDEWIGWDWSIRRRYLERVVCLSRFLIRPGVQCRNLASAVLGLFVRSVGEDFRQHYGYRPWLIETFVDTTRHVGTCFRAANWLRVGCTKGRGRYDSQGQFAESVKDIYLYSLTPEFRAQMGLAPDAGAVALEPADGVFGEHWAEREFGTAPLGDRRRSRRLAQIAAVKALDPTRPFTHCANGDAAQMHGFHRFIEHPDRDAINMATILEAHKQRTIKRIRNETRVLCAQDSSVLEYSSLRFCTGLGPTGANHTGIKGRGLRLHTTLALTTEGLPLGILNAECVPRKFYGKKTKEKRRKLPFEQKEGYRWLEGIMACEQAAEKLPQVRLVCVMDKEADIFELFDHAAEDRKVHLLVRVARNRKSDVADWLYEEVKESPLRQIVRLDLPGRRNRKRRLVTPYADLEIRYKPINMQVPKHKTHLGASPVALWAVYACEPNPPTNTAPIKWFLFSTEPIDSVERAQQALKEYSRRWRIEEWHKVLKSGCKIEDIIAADAETIGRVVAINMVIAWRVMLMTLLGREQPDLPAQILFSEVELQVLTRFAENEGYTPPNTVAQAVELTARLGGYRARNGDPPPGATVLWRGGIKLEFMARGAALLMPHDPG